MMGIQRGTWEHEKEYNKCKESAFIFRVASKQLILDIISMEIELKEICLAHHFRAFNSMGEAKLKLDLPNTQQLLQQLSFWLMKLYGHPLNRKGRSASHEFEKSHSIQRATLGKAHTSLCLEEQALFPNRTCCKNLERVWNATSIKSVTPCKELQLVRNYSCVIGRDYTHREKFYPKEKMSDETESGGSSLEGSPDNTPREQPSELQVTIGEHSKFIADNFDKLYDEVELLKVTICKYSCQWSTVLT